MTTPRRTCLPAFTLVSIALAAALAACATDPGDDDDDDTPARAGLDRCADPGVALGTQWNVSNLHGEIVSMAIAADGTAVLGTVDGAVKQWQLGTSAATAPLAGGRPSYGEPLTATGAPARALAIGAGGDSVLAGDDGAGLREWSLPGADNLRSVPLEGAALTALTARSATEVIAADTEHGGTMRVVDLRSGVAGPVFTTTLWGVSAFTGAGDSFFVVGHNYLRAAVERRTLADPTQVADLWDPQDVDGVLRSAALSPDGAWLATGGDGHVMVFAATDLAAGPVATLALDEPKFIPSAVAVAFSATGDHLAVAVAGRVLLLSRDLATEIASLDVPAPVALGLDPSGDRLVVASADGRLRSLTCE